MSLKSTALVAFVSVTNVDQARRFYRDVLGLSLVAEELPFALVFDANGVPLRVTLVNEVKPQPFTVLGWDVPDIRRIVPRLLESGVVFVRFPGLNDSDDLGIWTAPGGAQIAWFRDPDGNLLSVSQTTPA